MTANTLLRMRARGYACAGTLLLSAWAAGPASAQTASQTDIMILQGVNSLKNSATQQLALLNSLQASSGQQQTALSALQASASQIQATLAAIQTSLASLQSSVNTLQTAVNRIPLDPRKKFYLTTSTHDGAHALTACDTGFHMASYWEMQDLSNLSYDRGRGYTLADAGFGPPASTGWIRTGYFPNPTDNPGIANCSTWTSADAGDHGSVIELSFEWDDSPTFVVDPFYPATDTCDSTRRVWCKQD